MFGFKKQEKKNTYNEKELKNQRLYTRYKIALKTIYVSIDGLDYPIIDFSYGGLALLGAENVPEETTAKLHFMKYVAIIELKKIYTKEKRSGFMIKHESRESLEQLSPIIEGLNASEKMVFTEDSQRIDKFKGRNWIVLESVDYNELFVELGDDDNIVSFIAIFNFEDEYKRINWSQGAALRVTKSPDRVGAETTPIESNISRQATLAFFIAFIIGLNKKNKTFKKHLVQSLHVIGQYFN